MTIAVQVRGLRKSYKAGVGSCLAAVEVLRGIELTLCAGEAIGIVGSANSGKSTLLLCLAGILSPDAGEIAWFDRRDRAVAGTRAFYHVARADLRRVAPAPEPRLHLLDLDSSDDLHVAPWIETRRKQGDAIVVAARAAHSGTPLDRCCILDAGYLRPASGLATRVAESTS